MGRRGCIDHVWLNKQYDVKIDFKIELLLRSSDVIYTTQSN